MQELQKSHFTQDLQIYQYPQLMSCKNYKSIHNSYHKRIKKISTMHIMHDLQKYQYPQSTTHVMQELHVKISTNHIMQEIQKYLRLISCMIYTNINIHNSCHARISPDK